MSYKSSGFIIIVITALLIEVTSIAQYWFARKGISEEVEHRAETELRVKNLEIQKVMVAVETAVNNAMWDINNHLYHPDSLYSPLHRLVATNPTIVGAGITFVADYYPQKGRWYEPYVAQRNDSTIEESQIGSQSHDYLNADFYLTGMAADGGHWSEPYYDDAGARMMLCTFTLPIYNAAGEAIALIGADVSLDWLEATINARHIYPSSFNILISRTGKVIVCPEESIVMRRTIQEVTANTDDTTATHINNQMMAGQRGKSTLRENNGEKKYVFYAPIEGETGWSMAVVCSDEEIYKDLRQTSINLSLLMLVGLCLLAYIIFRSARNARKMQKINAEKERISSELHIASEIQKSMVPKTFPPYPQRHDVDIYATLLPAKEVGGDLYDYYMNNDNQLIFCIGDVSGKGVPASLVMAVTRSLFRTLSAQYSQPELIITAINNSMSEMNQTSMFVTLFIGVLDMHTGRLRYCNAGHEAPVIIDNRLNILDTGENIPIGLMPDWKYVAGQTTIQPGSTIFLYTDGVTEATDSSLRQFGKQRMITAVRNAINEEHRSADQDNTDSTPTVISTPKHIITSMTEAVKLFVGNNEQSDDLTMLAIKYTGE